MRLSIQTSMDLSRVAYLNCRDSLYDGTVETHQYSNADPHEALKPLQKVYPSVPWNLRRIQDSVYHIDESKPKVRSLPIGTKFTLNHILYIRIPEMVINGVYGDFLVNALRECSDHKIEALYINADTEVTV